MRHKIGFKLIALVGATAMVIIGIYAYINIHSQEEVLLKEVTRHGNQLSDAVKSSTKEAMLEYHRNRIQETINNISTDPSLHEISIMNKEGKVVYSTLEDQIGRTLKVDTENCYVCHAEHKPLSVLSIEQRTRLISVHPDSSRALGIINPIYNLPSCWQAACHAHEPEKKILGVLHVVLCLEEVDAQISKSKMWMAIFAIVSVLAISILIGFFVRRWIDQPVNYLLEAIRQVASGNLNYTIHEMGNDEIGSLATSFNNMTRKLAEARMQLFQSDKMASLGRLAAGVAHEINNPLTGVLTYSSFLQKRTKDQPEIQEDLKVIVSETLRSREIVKGLLDFARQTIPRKRKADINEIIKRAIRVVENQLQLRHIGIKTDLDPNLPEVVVDANQIQQVFINLLLNAGDAITREKGQCRISTRTVSLSLHGIHQIKKATCTKNHSLVDEEIRIDGLPALRIKAVTGSQENIIYIDPVYGKHQNIYGEFDIKNIQYRLLCPDCNVPLTNDREVCPECGLPVYAIIIPGQGQLEGCINPACVWQCWDTIDALGSVSYVESNVTDDGHGIPEKDLQKIFEPFYSTKGQSGTGLGLSVIWGIIDNHNGTISVQSKLDEGTTFTIRLPIEPVL